MAKLPEIILIISTVVISVQAIKDESYKQSIAKQRKLAFGLSGSLYSNYIS